MDNEQILSHAFAAGRGVPIEFRTLQLATQGNPAGGLRPARRPVALHPGDRISARPGTPCRAVRRGRRSNRDLRSAQSSALRTLCSGPWSNCRKRSRRSVKAISVLQSALTSATTKSETSAATSTYMLQQLRESREEIENSASHADVSRRAPGDARRVGGRLGPRDSQSARRNRRRHRNHRPRSPCDQPGARRSQRCSPRDRANQPHPDRSARNRASAPAADLPQQPQHDRRNMP